jgi:hypothetical protein
MEEQSNFFKTFSLPLREVKAKLIPEAEAHEVAGCNISVHQSTVFIFMLIL